MEKNDRYKNVRVLELKILLFAMTFVDYSEEHLPHENFWTR